MVTKRIDRLVDKIESNEAESRGIGDGSLQLLVLQNVGIHYDKCRAQRISFLEQRASGRKLPHCKTLGRAVVERLGQPNQVLR